MSIFAAILLASAPAQQAYELVVRFPGNGMGYNRVYRSLSACNRARAVILADHRDRIATQERETGIRFAIPPIAPTVVCVPL